MPQSKPWQKYDMNLWRAIRNTSRYWEARLMGDRGSLEASAYACSISYEERKAIQRYERRREYWAWWATGLRGQEIQAKMDRKTVAQVSARQRASHRRRRQRYGGDPKFGYEPFNRYILAKR